MQHDDHLDLLIVSLTQLFMLVLPQFCRSADDMSDRAPAMKGELLHLLQQQLEYGSSFIFVSVSQRASDFNLR